MPYIPDEHVERILSRLEAHAGHLYAAVMNPADAPDAPRHPYLLVALHDGPWRSLSGVFCLSGFRVRGGQRAVTKGEAARLVRLWLNLRYPGEAACSPEWSGDLPESLPADALPPRRKGAAS